MFFGVLIGFGFGICNLVNLCIIVEQVEVFVVVDVGVGMVSDVVVVMEFGVDVVFMNIVIVGVVDFVCMVWVMKFFVEVGWFVVNVGCILCKFYVIVLFLFEGFIEQSWLFCINGCLFF